MKYIIVMITMSVSSVVFAQKYLEVFSSKNIEKDFVKVDSMLYSCKYETTNVEYREFLSDLRQSGKTVEYTFALPDTNGWSSKLAYNQPFVELYFRHPAYQDYPMVNVSYEQAIKYCEWLTKKYNDNLKKEFKKVVFRLPSKLEWENAAHGGLKENVYSWESPYLKNKDCVYLCNFNDIGEEGITYDTIAKKYIASNQYSSGMVGLLNDHNDITCAVSSYFPNGFGLFNMSGNVSEMISEKGIAKGGSWKSPGYDVRIESQELYSKSLNHIGFRVFMEVLDK